MRRIVRRIVSKLRTGGFLHRGNGAVELLAVASIGRRFTNLLQGRQVRGAQRLGPRGLDVGLDADAFPVGLRDRIDRTPVGEPDAELVGDAPNTAGMSAPTGRFYDRRSLQILQVA